jgi:acetoin utilization protein AcuB
MIPDPVTISESASIEEALMLMKTYAFRHLPVVSENNLLEGLVTLADLKQGLIPSMLGTISLGDLIIKNPITVGPDEDIERAARLIYENKISGMPVVEGGRLVGILTETDILRTFIDMMGILTSSSRVDVVIGEEPGAFKRALQIIQDQGVDIINVGIAPETAPPRTYFFRLSPCKTETIKDALENAGFKVSEAMD